MQRAPCDEIQRPGRTRPPSFVPWSGRIGPASCIPAEWAVQAASHRKAAWNNDDPEREMAFRDEPTRDDRPLHLDPLVAPQERLRSRVFGPASRCARPAEKQAYPT